MFPVLSEIIPFVNTGLLLIIAGCFVTYVLKITRPYTSRIREAERRLDHLEASTREKKEAQS